MVEWKVGKFRIRNLEIITLIILLAITLVIIFLKEDTPLYYFIFDISDSIRRLGKRNTNALLIAFLITLGGNSSVLIIIPYPIVIYTLCALNPNDWILITIISGIGAALGEIISYYIGRLIGGVEKVQQSQVGERFHRMRIQFEKRPALVPVFVFFFALTPLPDDVLLVPLGMMKYNYWKTVIPSIIGKTLLCALICFLGAFSTIWGDFIPILQEMYPNFSIIWTLLEAMTPTREINPRIDLISFAFVFVFIYIMARMNFSGILKRFSRDRKQFQKLIVNGGIVTFDELIKEYQVINTAKFKEHLDALVTRYENIDSLDHKYKFHPIKDGKQSYRQSLRFIDFFYLDETIIETDHILKIKKELTKNKKRILKKIKKICVKENQIDIAQIQNLIAMPEDDFEKYILASLQKNNFKIQDNSVIIDNKIEDFMEIMHNSIITWLEVIEEREKKSKVEINKRKIRKIMRRKRHSLKNIKKYISKENSIEKKHLQLLLQIPPEIFKNIIIENLQQDQFMLEDEKFILNEDNRDDFILSIEISIYEWSRNSFEEQKKLENKLKNEKKISKQLKKKKKKLLKELTKNITDNQRIKISKVRSILGISQDEIQKNLIEDLKQKQIEIMDNFFIIADKKKEDFIGLAKESLEKWINLENEIIHQLKSEIDELKKQRKSVKKRKIPKSKKTERKRKKQKE